jgi:hypothetical protein
MMTTSTAGATLNPGKAFNGSQTLCDQEIAAKSRE